jgi:hypothetical protein
MRPPHCRLWKAATLAKLEIGWGDKRLTIPIRRADGELQGLLRYAPTATRTVKMMATPGTRLGPVPHPALDPSEWVVLTEGPGRHDLGALCRSAGDRGPGRSRIGIPPGRRR